MYHTRLIALAMVSTASLGIASPVSSGVETVLVDTNGTVIKPDNVSREDKLANYGWWFYGYHKLEAFKSGDFSTSNCVSFYNSPRNDWLDAIAISKTVAHCKMYENTYCGGNYFTLNVERTNGNHGLDTQHFNLAPEYQNWIGAIECSY